jgi:hypothetical protein
MICALVALLAYGAAPSPAAAPPPVITNQAGITRFLADEAHVNEVPPYLLVVNGRVRLFSTTGWSYAAYVRPGKSLISGAGAIDAGSYCRVSESDITGQRGLTPPGQLNPATYWRRNYYGVFSAELLEEPATGRRRVVAFLHGENKNEVLAGTYYDNTIRAPGRYAPSQYSGWDAKGTYHDDWDNYFAFVGLSYCPLTESDGNDLMAHDQGPVLWPGNGYVGPHNQSASGGLRHPFSIVSKGYVYVFYLDASRGTAEGRQGGIKVARAAVSSMAMPGSFLNYYGGAFGEPSLPRGFDKHDRSFFSRPGGKGTTLFDADRNAAVFRVARVRNSPYFLGLEERLDWDGTNIVLLLRYSKDLVNWSRPAEVPDTRTDHPDEMRLNYGTLVNRQCSSSTEIDLDGFYIFGSDIKARANYRYTTVAIPGG